MSTSKRVALRTGQVRTIRLRNGHYAVMQVLGDSQVAVFDCFQEQDDLDGLQLRADAVLFTCTVLKSVWVRSVSSTHPEVAPVSGLEYDDTRIDLGGGFREVTLWAGTADERTFLMMGAGKNSVRRVERQEGRIQERLEPIGRDEYDKTSHLELTNLCDYPSFNERLYLCELFGRNIDPLKEIAFNRQLDPRCRTYVDIIAGKTPLALLGY